ncbi:hypothetical protein ACFSTH_01290 [Paenibacillus yanchengensis]|uniref:Uncharacterized protein n=1 Tax=Paenibacillus yanchengensis TaxID=2035833 RepID=A0ABW4YQK8_9BACL
MQSEISFIINSDDNIYLSGGTVQGLSILFSHELDVFWENG